MANKRYHVVCVSMVAGIYDGRFLGWAVADHAQANRVVSRKFWSQTDAQTEAYVMNAQEDSK